MKKRRWLSWVLCLVLLAGTTAPAHAVQTQETVTLDGVSYPVHRFCEPNELYYEYINDLLDLPNGTTTVISPDGEEVVLQNGTEELTDFRTVYSVGICVTGVQCTEKGYDRNTVVLAQMDVPAEIDGLPVTAVDVSRMPNATNPAADVPTVWLWKLHLPKTTDLFYGTEEYLRTLSAFSVDAENPTYMAHDGVLYRRTSTANKRILSCYPMGKRDARFVVPEWVGRLSKYAFYRNPYLQELVYDGKMISGEAIYHCDALRTVVFGNCVQYIIGSNPIAQCSALTTLHVPPEAFTYASDLNTGSDNLTVCSYEYGRFPEAYVRRNNARFQTCGTDHAPVPDSCLPRIGLGKLSYVYPGDTIRMPLVFENNPGVADVQVRIEFDSRALSPAGVENGELFSDGSLTVSCDESSMTLEWTGETVSQDGVLATLVFTVDENAAIGTTPIAVQADREGFLTTDGSLNIRQAYQVGDVNLDGNINLLDALMIKRYLVGGWEILVDPAYADVNGDGEITLVDVTMLLRSIVGGWDESHGTNPHSA